MIKYKSLEIVKEAKEVPGVPSAEELELINRSTITPLNADDVFTFKVILCDNEVDRVGDVLSDEALSSIAEKSKSLVGVKDHVWDSENSFARLYDAEVVTDGTVNEINGLPHKYVLGKAYTLRKFENFVDKVNSGILKECSISFNSIGDTCSICGGSTSKRADDRAVCDGGHTALESYDGKMCCNLIHNVTDTFEWSFVAVPCQRSAGVKAKKLGGKRMKKLGFLLSMSSVLKGLSPEESKELDSILETPADAEVDEKDIEALLERLDQLEAERDELKVKLEEALAAKEAAEGADAERQKTAAIKKAVEDLEPASEQVASDIIEKIDAEKVIVGEDGSVEGLDDQLEALKEKYKAVIGGGCGAPEKKEEPKVEEPKAEVKSKSFGGGFSIGKKADTGKLSFHEAVKKLSV